MIDIFSIFIWALLSFNVKVLQPDQIVINKNDKVLLMGDSHVENLDYVISRLAKKDGIEFKSVYVIGSTIRQWSIPVTKGWNLTSKWQSIYDFHPTIVLVSLGSNDAYSGDSGEIYVKDFLELMKNIENDYKIVWICPPTLARAKVGEEHVYNMIKYLGIEHYDSRDIEIDMEPDKLHTNGKGRKVWGNWIWNKLTH